MSPLFGQTAEYALRAVMQLAQRHPEPQTAQQISTSMQVPPSYLSKVMQNLARAGVVRSQRGLGGGFSLALPPDELSLLAVIEAVQPIARIEACPLQLESHSPKLCPLHRRLDDAIAQVQEAFGSTTLGELLREPTECQAMGQALESEGPAESQEP